MYSYLYYHLVMHLAKFVAVVSAMSVVNYITTISHVAAAVAVS